VVAWFQLLVLAAIAVGVLWLPAPFLLHHPGVVIDATRHLDGPVIADPAFGDGGRFLLTTQRTTPLTWGGYLWYSTQLPVGARVVPIPASAPRSHYVSLAAMDQSKDIAAAVAGCVVQRCTPVPIGARVVGVTAGSPAAQGGLRAGDVIVAASRFPAPRPYGAEAMPSAVTSLAAILRVLQFAETPATTAGQRTVQLDALRDGEAVQLRITSDGGPLGADLVTAWVAQRELEVGTGQVGGPSTGLMLALTLIDAMTAGDLAGGRRIAGTGTIAADGTVGPIGGVAAKVAGAQRADADVFLVPPLNGREARRAARRAAPPLNIPIEVVEVSTVTEALHWLCRAGGSSTSCIPSPPQQPVGASHDTVGRRPPTHVD
jgi:Lon-like protease